MSGRIPCSVPFCRRTAPQSKYPAGTQIICGKHWRLGDQLWRKRYSKASRLFNKSGVAKYNAILSYCWRRVLRQATERSAGISA